MALKVGDLVFNVRANTVALTNDLAKSKTDIGGFTAAVDNSLKNSAKALTRMGAGDLAKEFDKARGAANHLLAMKPWRPVVPNWYDQFAVDVNRAKQAAASLNAGGGSLTMAGIAGGIASQITGLIQRLLQAGIEFGRWAVNLAANSQTAKQSFGVLLNDFAAAPKLLERLRTLGTNLGIDPETLQQGARTLLSFGASGDSIIPTLKRIGEITGGDSERAKMLTLAFAQMSAAGRLMGQDLLQMVGAGFNPLQEISRKTGTSLIDLKKRMEDGGISSAEVADAFRTATEEGGKFFGMLQSQEGTFNREWGKMMAALADGARAIGETLLPLITQGIKDFTTDLQIAIAFGKRLYDGIAPVFQSLAATLKPLNDGITLTRDALRGLIDFRDMTPKDDGSKWDAYIEGINRANKAQEDFDKKRTEAMEKATGDLRKQADDLTKSLQTPLEKAADQWIQLRELMAKGLITDETFSRQLEKITADLEHAGNKAKELKAAVAPDVGAAISGTTQGSALVDTYRANEFKLAAAQKEQLTEQKTQSALLRQLLQAVEKKEAINVKKVGAL